jgi:hypothetical protein
MNRIVLTTGAVLIAAAYAAGFWPEHRHLVAARREVQSLQGQLDKVEGRERLGEVLGDLLNLSDAILARNYGRAAALSSAYFDRVRQETSRATERDAKEALNAILETRDRVTTAIARTEPLVSQGLRRQELTLRRALGYPVEPSAVDQPPQLTRDPR